MTALSLSTQLIGSHVMITGIAVALAVSAARKMTSCYLISYLYRTLLSILGLQAATMDRIQLATPDLRGDEALSVSAAVESGWVSSAGPEVVALEGMIARAANSRHAVATVSGTAALYLSLLSSGFGAGSTIAVPDWTFSATANAALAVGADIVFIDSEDESWGMSPHWLAEAVKSQQIDAVIVVHPLGHPADIDALKQAAGAAIVIEDAAGAMGATYRNRYVGSLADGAIFSFNGNKIVTSGSGGAFVTNDGKWAHQARSLSTQARVGHDYRYHAAGFNCRIGLAQMHRLDEFLRSKWRIAEQYDRAFSLRPDLRLMPRCDWAVSSCWLYSVETSSREDATSLIAHLDDAGIDARRFWERLSDQEPYAGRLVYGEDVAQRLSGRIVSIPCSTHLTFDEQYRVIDAIQSWEGGYVVGNR